MRVSDFFFLSWALALILAILIGVTSGAVAWEAAVFVLGVSAWNLFGQYRWQAVQRKLPPFLLWGTAFACAILGAYQYSASKDLVYLFSWTLMGGFAVVTGSSADEKGYWRAFTLTGLFSLICLIASESFLSFLLFMALGPVLLVLLNASHLKFHLKHEASADERLPRPYFHSLLGSIFAGLIVGALIFIFFPRSFQWQNPFAMRTKESQTGYSGSIELGSTNIAVSSQLAFIVESDKKNFLAINGAGMYFRARVLDHFDGKAWSLSQAKTRPYISSRSVRQTRAFDREKVLRIRVFREAHSTRAILYPEVLREIQVPRALQFQMRVDALGNLERGGGLRRDFVQADTLRYAYDVAFSPIQLPDRALEFPLNNYSRMRLRDGLFDGGEYLQVPREMADADWFKAFAKEAVGVNKGDTLASLLLRMALFFQSNFKTGYLGETFQTKDLRSFVTETRYGHCEYFASAAVMALRSVGIPARVVLGYRGGTYNPVSDVLEVRESEAHAWAEYYVPELGWVPLEPTPLAVKPTASGYLGAGAQVYSAVKFWFERYLVDYNMETQRAVFAELNIAPKETRTRKFSWGAFVVMAAGVFTFGFAFQVMRRRRRAATYLPQYWRKFERLCRRLGIAPRSKEESYLGFARRVSGRFAPGLVEDLYSALEREIYGMQPADSRLARQLLHRLNNPARS